MLIIIILILLTFLILGGKDNNQNLNKYLYHGSFKKFNILKKSPSRVIDNEPAVFATPSYISAVIFSAQWTDMNFSFGTVNGKIYLCEKYPGAINKLNKKGYIHYLDKKLFHHDKRLPPSELICFEEVKPIKCETVNIKKEIENSNVIIKRAPYEWKKVNSLNNNLVECEEFYVCNYIGYFDEIKKKLKINGQRWIYDANFNKDKFLIGSNLDEITGEFFEPKCKKKFFVVHPYINNRKTSKEEYKKYIDYMYKIYKDYKLIKLQN